jgi:glycosyltransferase involved in cell wall biosynthesis
LQFWRKGKTVRVLHLITGLGDGGAERSLTKILQANLDCEQSVITLIGGGKHEGTVAASAAGLLSLGFSRGRPTFRGLKKLREKIIEESPDVAVSWMYHSDLLSLAFWPRKGRTRIIWNVRCAPVPWGRGFLTRAVVTVLALLSRFVPDEIIYCSESVMIAHRRLGYTKRLGVVIHNGYQPIEVQLNPRQGGILGAPVVGHLARFGWEKDHRTLLQALGILRRQGFEFRAELAGTGVSTENRVLTRLIAAESISEMVTLSGPVRHFSEVMSRWDIFVLPSLTEGFQNSLAEATLMGLPCVATDVGAAREILGGEGLIVPPKDPFMLAGAIESLLVCGSEERERIGRNLRIHCVESFSLDQMAGSYARVFGIE